MTFLTFVSIIASVAGISFVSGLVICYISMVKYMDRALNPLLKEKILERLDIYYARQKARRA
jgi:hypothetical protein